MIVSASRRTDIPAFFADWLVRRLREGLVLTPHPRNPGRLGQVSLSPEVVDCIVFWTKNPAPMLERLKTIDDLGYRYYFSFTVTSYGPELEPHLPPKKEIVETFQRLADALGPGRVDWRYDPIVAAGPYTSQWHWDQFGRLASQLSGSTERCLINFVKPYRHLAGRFPAPEEVAVRELARGLAAIAAGEKLKLVNCTEQWDLRELGIKPEACLDRGRIEARVGGPIKAKKDQGQPALCRCLESFDLGMYDTCGHGCAYCYAVTSPERLHRRQAAHDPASPQLSGWPAGSEIITDRTRPSCRLGAEREQF